jgi:uncharacterized repeat protein (TIGR01451 family)
LEICYEVQGNGGGSGIANVTIEKDDLADPVFINASGLPNDNIYFVITVANEGPDSASNVVVTDTLPANFLVGNTPIVEPSFASGPADSACAAVAAGLRCDLGSIPAGETVTIIVPVAPDDPAEACVAGSMSNSAEVVWEDDDLVNTAGPDVEPVFFTCSSDVDIAKYAPAFVDFDDAFLNGFTYTMTVNNIGASPIPTGSLLIYDYLPAGLTYAGLAAGGGGCNVEEPADQALNGAVGPATLVFTSTQPFGIESCDLVITVAATDDSVCQNGGVIWNTAEVRVDDSTDDRDQAVAITQIGCGADLQISKTASAASVNAGGLITFTLTITNNGPTTAYDVRVIDELTGPGNPEGMIQVS